jgi:chromosome partitioning protein
VLRRALPEVNSHSPLVFSFANHKGGCAKTTSAANLAAALAERHHRVLAIDADPQGNLGETFGLAARGRGPRLEDRLIVEDPTPGPAIAAGRPGGVDLLPCSDRLEEAVTAHARHPAFAFRLAQLVGAVAQLYDVVIIDTPPGLGPLSSMAMLASDRVIVPARPADFDVMGAMKIAHLIRTTLQPANPRLALLGVLLTQVDRRWRLTTDARDALDRAQVRRLRVEVPARVQVGAAPRFGAPTFVLSPDGMVADAYRRLASDLDALVVAR